MTYRFIGSCVTLNGHAINDMKDDARDITRATFLKKVDREQLADLEQLLGYDRHPKQGLTMAGDAYVGYAKSRYQDHPVVYFTHSCTEYVFREEQS